MTQFITDENVPLETVDFLKKQGINVVSVTELSPGLSDLKILDLANKKDRIVITFDKDFGQLIFKEKRQTKGLMLLRFVPESPTQIAMRIQQVLAAKIKIEHCVVTVKKDSVKVTSVK